MADLTTTPRVNGAPTIEKETIMSTTGMSASQVRTLGVICEVLDGTRRIDEPGVPELDALNAIAGAAMRLDPWQLYRATPDTEAGKRWAVLRAAADKIAESLCAAHGLEPQYADELVVNAFSSHDPYDVPF